MKRFLTFFKDLPSLVVILSLYFLAGKLGLSLAEVNPSASAVWAPTGISIACLLIFGYRVAPAVFIGAFLVNITTAGTVFTSLAIAFGNTLEGVAAAYLVNKFAGGPAVFDRTQNIFKYFFLAGFYCTALSAAIGVTSLSLAGFSEWRNFFSVAGTWWLGDVGGALIIGPLIVVMSRRPIIEWDTKKLLEAAALLSLTALLICAVVFRPPELQIYHTSFPYLFIPLIVWGCVRFYRHGAVILTFILSVFMVWNTYSPGGITDAAERSALLTLELSLISAIGLILSAVMRENMLAQETLLESEERYGTAVRNSYEAMYIYDAKSKQITEANPAFLKLLGYTQSEIKTKSLYDIAAHDKAGVDEFYERILKEGAVDLGDRKWKRKDGTLLDVNVTASLLRTKKSMLIFVSGRDISDRKLAEQLLYDSRDVLEAMIKKRTGELRQSEDKFSKIFRYAPFPTSLISTETGKIIEVNQATLDALSYQREEMIGKTTLELGIIFDLEERNRELEKIKAKNAVVGLETKIRKSSGDLIDVMVSATPVMVNNEGCVLIIFYDITEKKHLTDEIKRSRIELQEYIDNMTTFNAKLDLNGNFILLGQVAKMASGLSEADLMKANFLEGQWWSFDPDVHSRVKDAFRRAVSGEYVNYDEKISVMSPAGTSVQLFINFSLIPVKGKDGKPSYILAEGRDISKQKIFESKLIEAQRVAHIGSWEWNIAENKVTWTDEMYRLYGLKPGSIEVNYEEFMSRIHPDDRDIVNRSITDASKNITTFQFEHRVIWDDGSIQWLEGRGNVVADETGKPVLMYGTGQDIKDRKNAEREIKKINEELENRVKARTGELEASNKELEAFAYSVSHDLRAPLRSLDGFSTILADQYSEKLDDEGKDYLIRIRRASQRMGKLIDDLLSLSRLMRSQMKAGSVNLSSLAFSVAEELKKKEPQRKVIFQIQPDLNVNGDRDLLRIMIENLINNAWKFTSKHKSALISVGSKNGIPGGSHRIFYVKDDGAGFDMAYADKLFAAFSRLHTVSEFEGTGIGLATVQRIVKRHHGDIWANSEIEKGATFYFTLNDN